MGSRRTLKRRQQRKAVVQTLLKRAQQMADPNYRPGISMAAVNRLMQRTCNKTVIDLFLADAPLMAQLRRR